MQSWVHTAGISCIVLHDTIAGYKFQFELNEQAQVTHKPSQRQQDHLAVAEASLGLAFLCLQAASSAACYNLSASLNPEQML